MCEFCGVSLTRRHDLTRHQVTSKCKDFQPQSTSVQIQPVEEELAPAAEQQTSFQIQPVEEELAPAAEQQTSFQIQPVEEELAPAAEQQTSFQIQPVEEELAPAAEQQTSFQIQPVEEELAPAAEQQTSFQIQPVEEELAPAAEQQTSFQIQPVEEELAPAAEQQTSVQIQPVEEELAIKSFTAIAPEGVEVGSTQFYQFISSAVEDPTNDFDVSDTEVAESRVLQLKPAVLRNGTNLLPGLEIPQDKLSFRQVLEGVPLKRKINVCSARS